MKIDATPNWDSSVNYDYPTNETKIEHKGNIYHVKDNQFSLPDSTVSLGTIDDKTIHFDTAKIVRYYKMEIQKNNDLLEKIKQLEKENAELTDDLTYIKAQIDEVLD